MKNTLTMVHRSLRRDMRSIDALIMAIVLPVMILVLFTIVFGGAIDTGIDYINYVVPGIFLLCVGFGTAGTAVSVCSDSMTGLMDRFRSLPIGSASVLTGHVVSGVVRNTLTMVVVILLAIVLGFRPNADPVEWLATFGILWLLMLAFTWAAVVFGLLVKSVEAAGSFSFTTLLLPYLSSAFVPIDTLPKWIQGFAEHQPMTHIIETLRGLLLGNPIGNHGWWAIAWCLGIALVMYSVARVLFNIQSRQ